MNPAPSSSLNTHTIARNSFWYGLEMVFGIFASLVTSILVARLIGPVRLGPFNYVVWLTNITSAVGSFGLPTTTRKYMADYLNLGEAGTANAVYRFALKLQILIGAAVTVVGIALVFLVGDAGYHTVSLLLVLNMAPRMIGFIPSQANNAAEKMRQNTAPALIGAGLNTVLTLLSLWLGWGLIGIASGIIASASIETVLKLRSAYRLLAQAPPVAISPDLRRRMFSYSGQGVVLMLLNVIVWDRSDMIILKALNPDVRQLSFFSTAFNLTERILLLPNAFAGSLSVTIMAQFARGQERLQQLTMLGAKYSFLIALPLLGGMACISRPMILLLYGEGFRPMIPVFAVVSLLAISKALLAPPTALLQATERQGALIWIGCLGGVLDIGLDFLLTPSHGALGAAIANGTAQTFAAIAVWYWAHRSYPMSNLLRGLGPIAAAGLGMAAVVLAIGYYMPGSLGMAVAILVGALVWMIFLRLTGAIDSADRDRLMHLGKILPSATRPFLAALVKSL